MNELIPAWLVAAFAFLAAGTLLTVRPMPWKIRISLSAPLVYFGGLYLYVTVTNMQAIQRTELVRLGLALIFFTISFNAVLVRYLWKRRGHL